MSDNDEFGTPSLIEDDSTDSAFDSLQDSDSDSGNEKEITALEFEHQIQKYGLGFKKEINPVYDSDTSDEENENTIGNIPVKWYDEYDHVGYNKDGIKIAKGASKDEVDKFLENSDSRDIWKTVLNEMGETVTLTKEELEIMDRIERGLYGDTTYDPFSATIEWFTSKIEVMPLSGAPEPKRRFIPSKNEARKVILFYYVHFFMIRS